MSIEDVFPTPIMSATEENLIAEAFGSPVVRKYLKMLAANDAKELLALSAMQLDKDKLASAHATVQGKLQVIATLLAIEAPQPKQSQQE